MTQYDDNNIFAKILRGEIPNDTVYENDHVLALRDIAPQAAVHILVIPKGAYISADDFGAKARDAEIVAIHRAISDIVQEQGLSADGFRVIANTGDHGGQEVPHLHYHILGGEPLGAMIAK